MPLLLIQNAEILEYAEKQEIKLIFYKVKLISDAKVKNSFTN